MTRTRKGAPDSEVRAQLIDAAHQMILEESCRDLTAGKLAERVGLKRQIVHYYFGTLDDLFIAVLEKMADESRARFRNALEADAPLRMTWQQTHDASSTLMDFISLAMQRESIREVLARYMDEFRLMQVNALESYFKKRGIKSKTPAVVYTLIIASISQALALENALGVSMGHEQTRKLIEDWLDAIETDNKKDSRIDRLL